MTTAHVSHPLLAGLLLALSWALPSGVARAEEAGPSASESPTPIEAPGKSPDDGKKPDEAAPADPALKPNDPAKPNDAAKPVQAVQAEEAVDPDEDKDADEDEDGDEAPWPSPLGDPRRGEVPVPSGDGWNAFLMHDNRGVGVWTVKSFPVFDHLACPEVVALDDYGRLYVMVDYSGKWTPVETVNDGWWLGGLAHGDVDPRVPGAEIYTGSQKGRIYQVIPHRHGALESRLLAYLPGREIHTLVVGELDPQHDGQEILAFTRPGGLFRLTPDASHGAFVVEHLEDLVGRIRDAVILPGEPGTAPQIATVSRDGRLRLLQLTPEGPRWETIYAAPMGMGRIAMRPPAEGSPLVLYSTHDDGRILRHERGATGGWSTVTIYLGPQGARGVAAGRFGEDPSKETVAVFGYSRRVEILERTEDGWRVENAFTGLSEGHWLCRADVDGRNATDELIACGFDGKVFLLTRPPGFGRKELAAEAPSPAR